MCYSWQSCMCTIVSHLQQPSLISLTRGRSLSALAALVLISLLCTSDICEMAVTSRGSEAAAPCAHAASLALVIHLWKSGFEGLPC